MRSLIFGISILFVVSLQAQNDSIQFIKQDFSAAKAKAKKQGKFIFVDAYTTWCGPCKWMAANMFTNDTIARFFNQHFVNLKMDMEKGEGVTMAKEFGVRFYPTTLILDENGNELHRSVGASRKVADYIDFGLLGMNPLERLSAYHTRWKNGEREDEFVTEYLKKRDEAGLENEEILDEYYAPKSESELQDESSWNVIYEYDKSVNSKGMQTLLTQREQFSQRYGQSKVEEKLYKNYLSYLYSKVYSREFSMKEMELTMIEIKKKQVPYWEKIILQGDLAHLKREKKYKDYCEVATEDLGDYFNEDPYALNEFAWNVFEWSKKNEQLEVALGWAKRALELEDEPMIRDTYANLLYKLGKKEEARVEQQKAIDQLKAQGEDASDYEKTLEGFK